MREKGEGGKEGRDGERGAGERGGRGSDKEREAGRDRYYR